MGACLFCALIVCCTLTCMFVCGCTCFGMKVAASKKHVKTMQDPSDASELKALSPSVKIKIINADKDQEQIDWVNKQIPKGNTIQDLEAFPYHDNGLEKSDIKLMPTMNKEIEELKRPEGGPRPITSQKEFIPAMVP